MDIHTVLLVDDDPDIRLIGEIALARVGGWVVHTVASGDEALAAASAIRPDVVVLDVMMPGMDGPQTLQHLKSRPDTSSIPVIFLTAKLLPREVESYMESGAIGVIAKPFDPLGLPDEIRTTVAVAMREGHDAR